MELLDQIYFDNTVRDYAYFLGTIILIWIFNGFLAKLIGKLLYRLFVRLTPGDMGGRFVELLQRPLALLFMLIGVSLAFHWLDWPEGAFWEGSLYGITVPRLLQGLYQLLMVLVVCWILTRIAAFIVEMLWNKASETDSKQDDQYVLFIKDTMRVVIFIFGLFLILGGVFKLNITGLIAGAGLAGLAIALAAQDSLQNLLGSITIFSEKPFIVGDFIQVGETTGVVEKVGFRSTRIRTVEKSFVTLPNKTIVNGTLDNMTLRSSRRVKSVIGLTYDTNQEQLKKIVDDIQQLLDAHEGTNEDGVVGFHEFGASSLDILVIYYLKEVDYTNFVRTKEEINFKIMDIVSKHGSDFAFPTQTIHMNQG